MNPALLMQAVQSLHFIRPDWLWTLLLLPIGFLWWQARQRRRGAWDAIVDPHLLPHLVDGHMPGRSRLMFGVASLAVLLATLALAGPSWRQVEQPVWQPRAPLVIALDLSSATTASDIPPSRLAQARAKIAMLLRERADGQVGLVVFAMQGYTVSPLTTDAGNVALYLDSLDPDVMPVDGQRVDRGIAWSARLMKQAGFEHGQILLLTDHADGDARAAATKAAAEGFQVSVIGLGSASGAAYRRRDGTLAQAQLDEASLRQLAADGGGAYARLQPDESDLQALGVLEPASMQGANAEQTGDETGRQWQDEGYWLLPPLMLLGLLAFRRRSGVVAVLLLCAWLPIRPAQAVEWWQRPDQIAHETMEQATQAYRKEDFEGAAQQYRRVDTADGHYNQGNALAKAGRYPQAIEAYDRALKLQPGMDDALANKRAVEAAMNRKPPPGQKPQPGDGDKSEPEKKEQPDPQKNDAGSPKQSDPSADGKPQDDDGSQDPQEKQPPDSAGKSPATDKPPEQPEAADAQAQKDQQDADNAQRERMKKALEQSKSEAKQSGEAEVKPDETPQEREQRLANQAWLNRVADDPGGLLREKFRLEYQRRRMQGDAGE